MKKSGARTSPFSLYNRGDPQVWKAPAVLEYFDGESHNLLEWTKSFYAKSKWKKDGMRMLLTL
jgi:hypothetical protein